jgi:trimethylamine---corrinoid protein Co-methyltransferase
LKLNTICVLSDNEIHEIHLQSLEILEKIGIHIQEDTALEIFEKAGAKVDWNIKRVFIPQYLTKDALAKANPNLSLYNTDGVRSMTLGAVTNILQPLDMHLF